MILELITALRSLENEIRSKFDHIEGLVTEVSNKIGALENAIELERTTRTAYSLLTNGTVPSCSWYSQSSQASDATLDEPTSIKKEISPDINPNGDEAVDANQYGTTDEVTVSNDEIISHIFSSSRSVDKPRSCRKSTKESLFKLSLAERSEVVLLANGRSRKEVVEEFNRRHPNRPPISSNCVKRLLTKLKETGSVHDRPRSGRPRKATTEDQVAIVLESLQCSPRKSIRCLSRETGISTTSICRILREHGT
ncbi:hypothetical protein OESDEN_21197 [Oesophagostomum dentatum]|uniref:Uncharacterized protein n=1 Tax=Oesophagostomum dentatum TaxID=61180 RepID=A0A0B1S1G5_OESDE|nr:hypothetical protein OESDEN_21197 [Oesophagostomum dentatum]